VRRSRRRGRGPGEAGFGDGGGVGKSAAVDSEGVVGVKGAAKEDSKG